MKIFIEIPTWLGDAVMTSPAIENIIKTYPKAKLTLFGSFVSSEVLKRHPNVEETILDDSKLSGNRYKNLWTLAKNAKKFDLAFSFRKNFTTKFLMFFLKSKKKFIYKRYTKAKRHQVLRYNDFINKSLDINLEANDLKLYFKKFNFAKPTLGLSPGAAYGSAKRWYPKEFAKVALGLHKKYNIVILGSKNEVKIASEIEKELRKNKVKNYTNLVGNTSIQELVEIIAGLSIILTNDSGPLHISAAFKIKTLAIFGPTDFTESSGWHNDNEIIIKKNLPCMPCAKRVCPLKHHKCMKELKAKDVLASLDKANDLNIKIKGEEKINPKKSINSKNIK